MRSSRRRRLGLLAVLVFAAASPASASGAVIGFDGLTDVPPKGGPGKVVNVQYADQGVTFNDVSAYDYTSDPGPDFPHSGAIAVETPCFALELCQAPIVARFTAGQDSVRVWVGYSDESDDPVSATMTAWDAENGGNQIGSVTAPLPVSSTDAANVDTPLFLDPSGARIRRIEVTTGSGFTTNLTVDDVEFSTTGPPPPCNATGPPTIALLQPQNGYEAQRDAFPLEGSVDPNGAPLTDAEIVVASANPEIGSLFPRLVDGDGGRFGLIYAGGLLAQGKNDIVVRATNCAGTGESNPTQVSYEPIEPGSFFRQLGEVEVAQTVQNPGNGVPLIAATGGGVKRTFARVYLRLEGNTSTTNILRVSGRLTASRRDGSLPGGPATIPALNTITVNRNTPRDDLRHRLQDSLNFELPAEWLGEGDLHLQLDHLTIDGQQSSLGCAGCENPRLPGPPGPETVHFHAVPPLRVWIVQAPYRLAPGGNAIMPTQTDIDLLASWLRRAYPAADVRITNATLPVRDQPYPNCDNLNATLTFWALQIPGQPIQTRYYGLADDANGLNFLRGCAILNGGTVASGPTGAPSSGYASWDTDDSFGDWYGGHEIAHTFGRFHPGRCGETDDDDDFPYAGGLIGGSTFDNIGLDAGDSALDLPFQLYDWQQGWSDVMTYCDKQWISPYTYRGILRQICEEPPGCPDIAEEDGIELPPEAGAAAAGRTAAAKKRKKPRLAVSGSLRPKSGRLSLDPLTVLPGLRLLERPRKSRYAIVLRGRGGRKLKRYPFTPKEESDLPPGKERAIIQEVVPFRAKTRRVLIKEGKRTLESVRVSRHEPRVRVTKPRKRRARGDSVKVRWRGKDRDGDRLTYSLLYSHRGKRFIPIAAGLRKRSYRVDLTGLPGGPKARFRVVATDGVLADAATSRRFAVPVKRPSVRISSPVAGRILLAGQPTQFVATVTDLQDPAFPAGGIVWRSSVQGELGRGPSISASLRPGRHEITVIATNRGGATTRETIEVTAEPPPETVDLTP